MRALAITAAILLSILGTSYAACGPDEQPSPWIVCSGGRPDAGDRSLVTLRATCPGSDAPLYIYQGYGFTLWNVWVELPVSTGEDRCVDAEIEVPFADGTRGWVSADVVEVDRVRASDGFCASITHRYPPEFARGATTVRVRVVGATFAGEAEFAANIR